METRIEDFQVTEILPHRYPFLLIDRVLEITPGPDPKLRVGRKAVVLKNVTHNEHFFEGHFPGRPIMPGVLLVEAMAQAGCMAFYMPSDANTKIDVAIASIRDARFRRPVVPGDALIMTCEVVKDRGQMIVIRCEARVGGQQVAEAEMMASIVFTPKVQ